MKLEILIVEDEKALRRNLEIFLSTFGHRIRCASCGKDAIKMLDHRFDIVVTDICLGDIDGLAIARRVISRTADTGVIVMTALGSPHSASEVFKSGAHDLIIKPFALDELEQRINKVTKYIALELGIARLRKKIRRLQRSGR